MRRRQDASLVSQLTELQNGPAVNGLQTAGAQSRVGLTHCGPVPHIWTFSGLADLTFERAGDDGRTMDKRAQLVQAAAKLAHEQGLATTTLAEIAKEAKIPVGNVYYYFKTKDDIAEAIVAERLAEFRAFQQGLPEDQSPKERLLAFVETSIDSRTMLAHSGCPVGNLCAELQRKGGTLARKARNLLGEPLDWLEAQFRSLGKRADARGLAVHLVSALQGASLLTHVFRDSKVVTMEAERLKQWIRGL
jgi:TetR/AcrR family transcriptional regulator, transcriptional repressor for nem operon